jgi:ubiquinone/menaquinone biosynthesis C-methylase UbiE
MDSVEIQNLADLESEHWWYVLRSESVQKWALSLPAGSKILDVGSASGGNTLLLGELGFNVTSLEMTELGVELQLKKGIHVVKGDATDLPFESNQFDAILCLDVLEHIEDDISALTEMYRVTKPEGKFLFSVPEDPRLWSQHDEAVSHVRRYSRNEFENKTTGVGFQISTTWSSLVLLKWPIKIYRLFSKGSSLKKEFFLINSTLLRLGRFERRVMPSGFSGVTLWCEGSKPK